MNNTLLRKLLSEKFDLDLNSLETNAKWHLDLINASLILTTKVVTLCANISSKAKERMQQKQRPLTSLNNNSSIKRQSKNGLTPKYNNSKVLQPKTPVREMLPSSKSVSRFDKSGLVAKELTKSHSYGNLLNKRNNDKVPKRSTTVKVFSPNRREGLVTTGNTRMMKGNNKPKRPSISSTKNTNNSFKVVKVTSKIKNIKMIRKQTPRQISRTLDNDSIDRILSINNTINNDYLLNKEDPLLIMPITDNDFIDLIDQIDTHCYNNNFKYKVEMFHIEEWVDDHLITMLRYLSVNDILLLSLVNKTFSNKIKQYLLSLLEEESKTYTDLLSTLDKPVLTQEANTNHFNQKVQFTKKTSKAIALLNESVINKLFTESKVPSNDILLIYTIYFQMINHPIARAIDNKRIFWKKCCGYFNIESDGKTGDLLERTLTDSLVSSTENMYKLLHLINGNLFKITPSYFSKMCGTTGLIVFFIQDVLEHFGISNDKKEKSKGYQLYGKIIQIIGNKITKIKSYMK